MTKPILQEKEQEEQEEDISIFEASILLVCGLPGSGKSTLIKSIVGHYSSLLFHPNNRLQNNNKNNDEDESDHYFDDIVVIDYDKITASIASTIHITNTDDDNNNNNDNDDNNHSHHDDYFTKEELEAWRRTRKEALNQLEKELHKGLQFIMTHEQKTTLSSPLVTSKKRKILIIMDDNFHLRSMRRNIYQKCQQFIMANLSENKKQVTGSHNNDETDIPYNIGLVIIHLDLPLEQCIQQNEQRKETKQYIPKHIIHNMNTVFEKPNKSHNFESNAISIHDTNTYTYYTSSTSFYPHLNKLIHKSLSLESKIKPPQTFDKLNNPQYQYEREMTMKSKLHRIDLLLRSLVSAVCREFVTLAKVANGCRKLMLNELRNDVKCNSTIREGQSMSLCDFLSNDGDDEEEDGDGYDKLLQFFDESNIVIEFGKRIISDSSSSVNNDEQEQVKFILEQAYDAFLQNQTSSF
jgi:tRNA uridine 5-carbamoylmethylation protein Kti12